MNNKVAIFSDIHINHSNEQDKLHEGLKCLNWIYQTAIDLNIDTIIFAGDLFHHRNKINTYAYQKVYEILSKYKNKIDSYYLIGNHDMYYNDQWLISSIHPLQDTIKQVIVEPCTIKIKNKNIDFFPYTHEPKLHFDKFCNNSDILIGHLSISGAVINTKYNIKYKSDTIIEDIQQTTPEFFNTNYKKVFLGHFHARQNISNIIEYIGSPYQLSFGESLDDKGFIILDLDNLKTEFIVNDFSPKYFIINNENEVEKNNLENSYIRLNINLDEHNKLDLINYRKSFIEEYKPNKLEIIFNQSNIKEKDQLNEIEKITKNNGSIIEQYVKSINQDLDTQRLKNIGNFILQNDIPKNIDKNYFIDNFQFIKNDN